MAKYQSNIIIPYLSSEHYQKDLESFEIVLKSFVAVLPLITDNLIKNHTGGTQKEYLISSIMKKFNSILENDLNTVQALRIHSYMLQSLTKKLA